LTTFIEVGSKLIAVERITSIETRAIDLQGGGYCVSVRLGADQVALRGDAGSSFLIALALLDDVRIVNDYPDDPKAGEAHQDLGNQPDARDPRKEP
jgi:hypothetical protein